MEIDKCPWPGCKNRPTVHRAGLPDGEYVYWVVCDTTVTTDNRLRKAGHMVTGPESDTSEGAIERWNARLLVDNSLGRPQKK